MKATASKIKSRSTLTGLGYCFCAVAFAVFLLAVNHSNNLLFSYSFLLFSILLVNLYFSRANMRGLTGRCVSVKHAFVGDQYSYLLALKAQQKPVLQVSFESAKHAIDVGCEDSSVYHYPFTATTRGKITAKTLIAQSYWPLGLFKATRYLAELPEVVIYPKAENLAPVPLKIKATDAQSLQQSTDLDTLRKYNQGDSLKRIHWPSFAKNEQLQVKEFGGDHGTPSNVLDYSRLTLLDEEQRLNCLSYWLVDKHRAGELIGLNLPHQSIAASHSEQHLHLCLESLSCMPKSAVVTTGAVS